MTELSVQPTNFGNNLHFFVIICNGAHIVHGISEDNTKHPIFGFATRRTYDVQNTKIQIINMYPLIAKNVIATDLIQMGQTTWQHMVLTTSGQLLTYKNGNSNNSTQKMSPIDGLFDIDKIDGDSNFILLRKNGSVLYHGIALKCKEAMPTNFVASKLNDNFVEIWCNGHPINNAIDVAVGRNHALILLSTGELYGFGQLYYGCHDETFDAPRRINLEEHNIEDVKCGNYVGISCGFRVNVISYKNKHILFPFGSAFYTKLQINKVVVHYGIKLALCDGQVFFFNDAFEWIKINLSNNGRAICISNNYVMCNNGDIMEIECGSFVKKTTKLINLLHNVRYWISPADNNKPEYDENYMTCEQINISMAAGLLFANLGYVAAGVDIIDVDVLTYWPMFC